MTFTTTYELINESALTSVSLATGFQSSGSVVATGNGNSAVFYYDLPAGEIAARTVSSSNVVGPRVTASSGSVYVYEGALDEFDSLSTARLNNGNIVLTWSSNEPTKNIYFRIFDSNLNPLTAATLAETFALNAIRPDVTALAGGGFAIAWENVFSATDHDISYRQYSAAGAPVGNSIAYSAGQTLDGSNVLDQAVSIAGLTDGGIAIGWGHFTAASGFRSVYYGIVNADDSVRRPASELVSVGSTHPDVDISARADGTFVVGWSATSGGTDTEIGTATLSATGAFLDYTSFDSTYRDGLVTSGVSPEGFIVTGQTSFENGSSGITYVSLLSPSAGGTFDVQPYLSAGSQNYQRNASLTWIDGGTIRLVVDKFTSSTQAGQDPDAGIETMTFNVSRHSIGDAANDVMNFGTSGLFNELYGGGGNDTLVGGARDDLLDGGNNDDIIIGGAGNDLIYPGAGINEVYGGPGNDYYFVSVAGDSIIESPGEGYDVVYTSVPVYTLRNNVDYLIYEGFGSFIGIGNADDNVIVGARQVDTLIGLSGNDNLSDKDRGDLVTTGSFDTLIGGIGDDYYNVTEIGTSTIEKLGEGIDTVDTRFSIYSLQANIENLVLSVSGDHQAGVGNTLDNVIRGGYDRDDLFGREGNDTLYGGFQTANLLLGQQGDDVYYVDAVGDSVLEFASEGTDTVRASVPSFTLPINVENLTFVGTGDFIGVGNGASNAITGGAAVDSLSGLGGDDRLLSGSGADILQGGAGLDQFRYAGGETGVDRVLDFVSGQDKIALANTGFTHTATIAFIQTGAPVPTSSISTFMYNVNNGIVSYDADGTGAGQAVLLAQLNAGLVLAAGDFVFY